MAVNIRYFGIVGFNFPLPSGGGGDCDYPDEGDVREGIVYGNGFYTGYLHGFVGDLNLPASAYHSPADILRAALIKDGLGTAPRDQLDWPVYMSVEPSSPDNLISCFDTGEESHGKRQYDGRTSYHYATMIRLRSIDHNGGWEKAEQIRAWLDEVLKNLEVTLLDSTGDPITYLIRSASKVSGVRTLDRESPHSMLRMFTVNCYLSILKRS